MFARLGEVLNFEKHAPAAGPEGSVRRARRPHRVHWCERRRIGTVQAEHVTGEDIDLLPVAMDKRAMCQRSGSKANHARSRTASTHLVQVAGQQLDLEAFEPGERTPSVR